MKVLITTDGHDAALHAMDSAAKLLPLTTADVRLLSVMDPEVRIGGNEDAADDLTRGCAHLAERGVIATPVQRRGHFADEILAEATAFGADVIVMGSHARGRLAHWFGGSVSESVSHRWKGAVLIVTSG